MAERTLQILKEEERSAPFSYIVPASTFFTLLGVRALFDGSGAGGNFLPCVQLVSDAGVVMAFGLGSSVTAGDSADVSFAPFLRGQTSGGADNAVHYDVNAESGGFLNVRTTTGAISIDENSGQALYLSSENPDNVSGGFVSITTADGETFIASTVIVNRLNPSGGGFEVQQHNGPKLMQITEGGYTFFFLRSGTSFEVDDQFGSPLLRVDEGGGTPTYHIKTGAAWVADL